MNSQMTGNHFSNCILIVECIPQQQCGYSYCPLYAFQKNMYRTHIHKVIKIKKCDFWDIQYELFTNNFPICQYNIFIYF